MREIVHIFNGGYMCRLAVLALMVTALAPAAACAEGSAPVPPPIAQSAMENYCVYGNLIYSFGSGLCLGKSGGLICVPSVKDKIDVAGRGYWHQGPEIEIGGKKYNPPLCP
jgi:hypothetical protein